MGAKRQRVLLVEDHPDLLHAMQECVETLGFDPVVATDGKSAINCLREECPDLVCLDVVLPESNGYEVCNFIRNAPHLRDVRVLMMSGRGLAAEHAFAEEAGADDFLPKPFSREDFRRRVKRLLEKCSGRDGGGGA